MSSILGDKWKLSIIATYVAELWKIAEFCEYGPVMNDMLRDRLFCGTSNWIIQRCLLQESALTFEKALEVALSMEATIKDSLRLTSSCGDKDPPAQISKVNDHLSPRAPVGKDNRYHKPYIHTYVTYSQLTECPLASCCLATEISKANSRPRERCGLVESNSMMRGKNS